MVFQRVMNCGIMIGAIGGILLYDTPRMAMSFICVALLCAMLSLLVRT